MRAFMRFEILDRQPKKVGVLLELAQAEVAGIAKHSSDTPGLVIVIDVEPRSARWTPATDRTLTLRGIQKSLVLGGLKAISRADPRDVSDLPSRLPVPLVVFGSVGLPLGPPFGVIGIPSPVSLSSLVLTFFAYVGVTIAGVLAKAEFRNIKRPFTTAAILGSHEFEATSSHPELGRA